MNNDDVYAFVSYPTFFNETLKLMKSITHFKVPRDANNITQDTNLAAHWLQQGELLAYPTESVWGIGCDAYNKMAVEQILVIKQRPRDKGMIVVTDSIERIFPLIATLPKERRQEIIDSWESTLSTQFHDKDDTFATVEGSGSQLLANQRGVDEKGCIDRQPSIERQAHTWLLPIPNDTDQQFPTWITGKHQSIAVRVIHHPLIAQLCANMVSEHNPYGFIVSTSCNPSGQPPAISLDKAYDYFGTEIKYLKGETLKYTLPSQIRDAITGQVIR